ncbi:MAG: nucleoid-associated protein [Aerococcaceae bacterium]|nr:nucleoid-associated protein [Aerococcaceae bacterium]
MYIQQAILHILDKDSGNLLTSEHAMDLSDLWVREYLQKLIQKVQQSDIKTGLVQQTDDLYAYAEKIIDQFVAVSTELATDIYEIIAPAEEIAAADYVFFQGRDDVEHQWFGFIRLDYSTQYTHFLHAEAGVTNQLMRHQAILPSTSQKPTEAFLWNITTNTYQLLEKKYAIEGTKVNYLSEQVLKLAPEKAAPQTIKEIKKVVTSVAKQFEETPYEALAKTQQLIYEQLENDAEIQPKSVMEQVFSHNLSAQQAVRQAVDYYELPERMTLNNTPKYEKKYRKQKFKLANGIEITILVELYGNQDVVEFINQPDGTISVIIKNIEAIHNAFNG